MLREGATLPSIGAVLRHRTIETTNQYARVDGSLLSQVAQPWPEVALLDSVSATKEADLKQLFAMAQSWPREATKC